MFHHSLDLTRGFLPSTDPLTMLPEDTDNPHQELVFNKVINSIIQRLPTLLKEKKLGEEIKTIDHTFASHFLILEKWNDEQRILAVLFLSSIAQAYIFEDVNAKRQEIPAVIAKNLYRLAYEYQHRPMLTYNEYVLCNWKRLDTSKPISLENIEPIVTFTGTEDEKWFIKIHVVIEAECAMALKAANSLYKILKTISKSDDIDTEKIAHEIKMKLIFIKLSLDAAVILIRKMKEKCQPSIFWEQLRPFLQGWHAVSDIENRKKGVVFAGLENHEHDAYLYHGPSGAQSSILPALDAILNVKHEINSMSEHLDLFKSYMPRAHREIILKFERSSVSSFVETSSNDGLHRAYNETVLSVKQFRGAHLRLVHDYIYKPAALQGIEKKQIVGTGGSPLNLYLTGRFNSTGESRTMTMKM